MKHERSCGHVSFRMKRIVYLLGSVMGLLGSGTLSARQPLEVLFDGTPRVIVDDADAGRVEITAYWERLPADEVEGAYGPTVLSDGGYGADAVVRFRPELTEAGTYAVYLYWPSLEAQQPLATNASVSVRHAGGGQMLMVDQRANPKCWNLLGVFRFDPTRDAYVEIRNDAADGVVLADAVLFRILTEHEQANPPQPDTSVVRAH